MNVFPVFAVQQESENEEQHDKRQHIYPNSLPFGLYRLTHVLQEVYQVVDHLVIFFRAQGTSRLVVKTATGVQCFAVFAVEYIFTGQRIPKNPAVFGVDRARSAGAEGITIASRPR